MYTSSLACIPATHIHWFDLKVCILIRWSRYRATELRLLAVSMLLPHFRNVFRVSQRVFACRKVKIWSKHNVKRPMAVIAVIIIASASVWMYLRPRLSRIHCSLLLFFFRVAMLRVGVAQTTRCTNKAQPTTVRHRSSRHTTTINHQETSRNITFGAFPHSERPIIHPFVRDTRQRFLPRRFIHYSFTASPALATKNRH